MQQSFIEYVLQDLIREGSTIENNLYILPSKRSGVFLKHYLSSLLHKTVFTPRISSIEDVSDTPSIGQAIKKDMPIMTLNIRANNQHNLFKEIKRKNSNFNPSMKQHFW